MNRVSLLGLVSVGVLLPTAAFAQATANPDRADVQRVIAEFAAHVQAGDLGALDSFFPERGLHILTDDGTTHGWAEYRDGYLGPELSEYPELTYAHTAIEPVVRGDVAWVAFRREFSSADSVPVEGRGTAVLEKLEGRWLIVHLHMSR